MQDLPHRYEATATTDPDENVILRSENLPQLVSAPPVEFGGPGDKWSPEHLLAASVADCFILTFRAIASASKLEWTKLDCTAEGVLDRVERVTSFTGFTVKATLTVPSDGDTGKAQRLLEKAEGACMITNSLSAETHLETEIILES
jgi:peroxiredoxin-like protein